MFFSSLRTRKPSSQSLFSAILAQGISSPTPQIAPFVAPASRLERSVFLIGPLPRPQKSLKILSIHLQPVARSFPALSSPRPVVTAFICFSRMTTSNPDFFSPLQILNSLDKGILESAPETSMPSPLPQPERKVGTLIVSFFCFLSSNSR